MTCLDRRCLVPFDRREALSVEAAAEIAGRDARTLRRWCLDHSIGRRIAGGHWAVSSVALDMLLNDDVAALRAYLVGDRCSSLVLVYFERAGLADLPQRWASRLSVDA